MALSIDDLKTMFEEYFVEYYENELLDVMKSKEVEKHYGIEIRPTLLLERNNELGYELLRNAVTLLPQLDHVLILAQRKILSLMDRNHETLDPPLVVKTNVHVRMPSWPCKELHRTSVPRNRDVGNILTIYGTITRTTVPKMLEFRREYSCSKCKKIFVVQAEYEAYFVLKTPTKCPNVMSCSGTNFTPLKIVDQRNYKDYQEIKIQEQVNKLNIGTVPRSMWATLEDDLVDSCKPGDDVILCGLLLRRWKNDSPGNTHDIELFFRVHHVFVSNDQTSYITVTNELVSQFESFWNEHKSDELAARDIIVASVCPQVYGLYLIKLAVAVILAGGVGKQQESGKCRLRGESHLLLVGDPGTAKSHIIRFAAKICSRSVHTTGIGSTSAGLTVTVVHEGGEWQLEAGALVLADRGICCIDEFNSIREHDRTAIHEAMEQQSISVAKAGVVCKLNTRCSIIAGTNPKGHYDSEIPLSVNVSVASPLLSRFDLVFLLLDSKNPAWDEIVSGFILDNQGEITATGSTSLWKIEKMQEYFSVVKNLNPTLTEEANMVLQRYYQAHRQANQGQMARTTVRLLESLIRLSEGHARLMFRQKVLVQDAIVAITLIESSILSTSFFGHVDTLHTTFPTNPTAQYLEQARTVLEKLHITEIKLEGQSQIQNNRVLSAIRTQSAARGGNVNRNEGAVASSTAEDLSKILNNIRKTKEKTAFDVMVQERTRQKKKRIKPTRNVYRDSDSDDEFRPITKQRRKLSINDDDDEVLGEVNQIPSPIGSARAVNQPVASDLQPQDEVGVNLEDDDDDDPLPLFGQFINAKSKQLRPTTVDDNQTGPSTTNIEKSIGFTVRTSNHMNNEKMLTSNSNRNATSTSSQVAGPSHVNVHRSSRTDYVPFVSPAVRSIRASSNRAFNLSTSTRHDALQASKTDCPSRKRKNIASSTMNKLKMFAVSSTLAPEMSSTNAANDVASSSGNENRLQTTTTEPFVNGSDAARKFVSNTTSESESHKQTSASNSSVTSAFAFSGFVGSLSLFTVDHDDLSILDDL